MNTIVVLLPGIAGTSLSHETDSVSTWPVEVLKRALIDEPEALALLQDPTLTPGEPIPWQLSIDVLDFGYRGFRDHFEALGFHSVVFRANNPGLPTALEERLLVAFAYDWRNDNGATASSPGTAGDLRKLLEGLHQTYQGTEYRVFLVGHSMGGLVSRAYLENTEYQKDPWYGNIAALVTLGTPHLGAPLAVSVVGGLLPPILGPYGKLAHDFVNKSMSVSAYELLPPEQSRFIGSGSTTYSVFDPAFRTTSAWKWLKDQGLREDKIARADEFLSGLNYSGGAQLPDYYCVYGTFRFLPTVQSFSFTDESGALHQHADTDGDSVVPRRSAAFEGRVVKDIYTPPGAVSHLQLASDEEVLKKITMWMGISVPVVHFTGIEVPAEVSA